MIIRATSLRIAATAVLCLSFTVFVRAQDPDPTPSSVATYAGYEITSNVEFGIRGLEVNGNTDKYRSDLNYRAGFRLFDSSFRLENRSGGSRAFDSALITTTGFGSDPSGSFRINLDKTGLYKFDSNVRRVKYYNFLNNHAAPEPFIGGVPRGQHNFDTDHKFGDFDLTIFPERESLRLKLGYSFNDTHGPGTFTTRFQGDEFDVRSDIDTESHDLRAGIEGKLLGFNLGLLYGRRWFFENTTYSQGQSPGNNVTNAVRIDLFDRFYPIDGTTDFVHFNSQRTFAKRLDFTGRFIYSLSRTDFTYRDLFVGRGSSAAATVIDLDQIDIFGDAKRPQARGDLGLTYRVTERLRISNTFTFDQFNIGGGNRYLEVFSQRNASGVPNFPAPTRTLFHRMTSYRRISNLADVDYQFSPRFGFNVGWRYTDRTVELYRLNLNLASGLPANNTPILNRHENTTHSFLAGGKLKPTHNWAIFADIEVGDSDNVFTRLANNEFLNFRVRSRTSFNRFSVNISAIWKENDSPGRAGFTTSAGTVTVPEFVSTVEARSRTFSASLDWTPRDDLSFSGGYTYQHLTSRADILVPISGVHRPGISEYFVRDSHFFFDVAARPFRRVSIFASYRINYDDGQGDRLAVRPEDIISSYPIRFQTPEVRLAIRLTRNIDWNVGYQYYDYKERQTQIPFIGFEQNYNAHLPYTSLRIYFGGAAER